MQYFHIYTYVHLLVLAIEDPADATGTPHSNMFIVYTYIHYVYICTSFATCKVLYATNICGVGVEAFWVILLEPHEVPCVYRPCVCVVLAHIIIRNSLSGHESLVLAPASLQVGFCFVDWGCMQ